MASAHARIKLFVLLLCLLVTGCSTQPYMYGTGRVDIDKDKYPSLEQRVYVGEPNGFLDASGWYWPPSLLGKLLLWDKTVDNHKITPETIAVMERFLNDNEMDNVQVLVNTYKPGNQWSRLFNNQTINPFWRYTLGVISVTFYTILPGRFFGGDAYNPYTHTVSLYSDNPSIALHEAGHAKDFASREMKGTNAFIYALPFAALYYEALATSDALSYLEDQGCSKEREDAYKILYPAYSTYVGGNLAPFVVGPAIQYAGVIPGHIAGQAAASNVPEVGPCGLYLEPTMSPSMMPSRGEGPEQEPPWAE